MVTNYYDYFAICLVFWGFLWQEWIFVLDAILLLAEMIHNTWCSLQWSHSVVPKTCIRFAGLVLLFV